MILFERTTFPTAREPLDNLLPKPGQITLLWPALHYRGDRHWVTIWQRSIAQLPGALRRRCKIKAPLRWNQTIADEAEPTENPDAGAKTASSRQNTASCTASSPLRCGGENFLKKLKQLRCPSRASSPRPGCRSPPDVRGDAERVEVREVVVVRKPDGGHQIRTQSLQPRPPIPWGSLLGETGASSIRALDINTGSRPCLSHITSRWERLAGGKQEGKREEPQQLAGELPRFSVVPSRLCEVRKCEIARSETHWAVLRGGTGRCATRLSECSRRSAATAVREAFERQTGGDLDTAGRVAMAWRWGRLKGRCLRAESVGAQMHFTPLE
ncbi:unnamed protein product [Lota lota]